MSDFGRRLVREGSFDITSKLFRISWLYVLLLTLLAGVGYVALYSAAGGAPEPYAARHLLRFGFGLVLMLCIAMIDIRFIQRMSWVAWVGGVVLLVLVLVALAGAGLFMVRKGDNRGDRDSRMARALALRVGLSIALFLFVLLS